MVRATHLRRSLLVTALVALCLPGIGMATTIGGGQLPGPNDPFSCPPKNKPQGFVNHTIAMDGLGDLIELTNLPGPSLTGVTGAHTRDQAGREVVPLYIQSLSVTSTSSSVGAVSFWLDTSRPVPSAIWENEPGTQFPATQEMRFHFLVSVEALPGRVFRSVNPVVMRSNFVNAFPPPSGTEYRMVNPVGLEDRDAPGQIVGHVLTGSFQMP